MGQQKLVCWRSAPTSNAYFGGVLQLDGFPYADQLALCMRCIFYGTSTSSLWSHLEDDALQLRNLILQVNWEVRVILRKGVLYQEMNN